MFIAIHDLTGDSGIRGFSESFNSGIHSFSEMSGMSSPNFQHPPSTIIQHSSHRVPLPQAHLQGQRGQNISLHPQAAATTPRVPLSSAYGIMHQYSELEPRHTRDLAFSDHITYNLHQSSVDPETMFRRRSTYQLRVPEEDVTIFSIFLPLLYKFIFLHYFINSC